MSILRFRRVELADWLLLTNKDRNTRYTVVNEDGSIYGEYIGDKKITENIEIDWANILNRPNFAEVATSGEYEDLEGKPDLALKLDKDFSALPAQANPLLTDVLVMNRGTTVQKVTLGNLLAQVDTQLYLVVAELPATGNPNKIYLVPNSGPETQNVLDEYIWVDNAWEKIGAVRVDLSNYFTKTEINSMFDGKQDKLVAGDNITIDATTNVISARDIGNNPDGVTIVLNEEDKLKVSEKLEIDGGFL